MSQDAINTSAQNAVVAINNLSKFIDLISTALKSISFSIGIPTDNTAPVTQTAVSPAPLNQFSEYIGSGSIASISVINPGTGSGYIYDRNAIGAILSESLVAIPATIGVYEINMRFVSGLVVAPGYGQTVIVSYSPD